MTNAARYNEAAAKLLPPEGAGLAPNSLLWMPLVLQGNSEPLDM